MDYNQKAENTIMVLVATYVFSGDSSIEKIIAQKTLQYVPEIPKLTVEQLAALCGVSVSSYLRFCRYMGYTSFTQFKMYVIQSLEKYLYIDAAPYKKDEMNRKNFWGKCREYVNNDIDRLEKFLDDDVCEKVVDLLYESEKVYFVDLMYSTIRFCLHGDLSVTGKYVSFMMPADDLDKTFKKELGLNSVVVLFYDGTMKTQKACEVIPVCKELGAKVVMISSENHFDNENMVDEYLFMGKASSRLSALLVHDMTIRYLSLLYQEKYMINKENH